MRNFLIRCLLKLLKWLGHKQYQILGGIDFMYLVQADNPDVGFSVNFTVVDSEGHEVPADSYNVVITSDNEDAVLLDVDESGVAGTAHFGSPGLANVNVTVEDLSGNILGSMGAQFTVVPGDPAAVFGGTIVFEGLEEAAPEEPEEETPEEPEEGEEGEEGGEEENPEFPDEEEPIIP